MCPRCDASCDFWYYTSVCYFTRLAVLVDNIGTVTFAAFIPIWGESLLLQYYAGDFSSPGTAAAVLFLKFWKRRQYRLQHKWGTYHYKTVEVIVLPIITLPKSPSHRHPPILPLPSFPSPSSPFHHHPLILTIPSSPSHPHPPIFTLITLTEYSNCHTHSPVVLSCIHTTTLTGAGASRVSAHHQEEDKGPSSREAAAALHEVQLRAEPL